MKNKKPLLLAGISTLAACAIAAGAINSSLIAKNAGAKLYPIVLDKSVSLDIQDGGYVGPSIISAGGDEIYVDIHGASESEGNFVKMNSDGSIMFLEEPLKGIKAIKVKGTGEFVVETTKDGETFHSRHHVVLDNEEKTLSFNFSTEYVIFGMRSETTFEKIEFDCTCDIVDITDENNKIYGVNGDFDFEVQSALTNNSHVATKMYLNEENCEESIMLMMDDYVDLDKYGVSFDIYTNSEYMYFDARLRNIVDTFSDPEDCGVEDVNRWNHVTIEDPVPDAEANILQITFHFIIEPTVFYIDNITTYAL